MKIELTSNTKVATIKIVVFYGNKPSIKENGVYYVKTSSDKVNIFDVFTRVDKKFAFAQDQVQKVELYLFKCRYNRTSLFLPLIEAGKRNARSKVTIIELESMDELKRRLIHWKKRSGN